MPEQNLVSATLSNADRDAAISTLADFEAKLPFLVGLTVDDRVNLQKMGNTRRAFVEQTVTVAGQNAQILPSTFDLKEIPARHGSLPSIGARDGRHPAHLRESKRHDDGVGE